MTVTAGDQYLKADFGYNGEGLGMIGDLVFEDENENGQYDGIDTILAGVSVSLIRDVNRNGSWENPTNRSSLRSRPIAAWTLTVATTSSMACRQDATWCMSATPTACSSITTGVHSDTADTNNHSQIDPYPVHLVTPGDDNLKADFGYVPLNIQDKGVTGNQVWLESDGNGIFSTVSGDIGQHGVTVDLLQGGNVVATTTTGASGDYAFLHLPPGLYDTEVSDTFGVLSGFQPTVYPLDQSSDHTNKKQAYPTGLATGGVNLTADFGYLCTPKLRGYIWKDMNLNGQRDPAEAGIAGIQVALLEDTLIVRCLR